MRRVVLTALAALALVAFTFSGCKKQPPVTPAGKTETKSSAGQPTTVAPAEKQAAPAPAPTTPAPAEKPAGSK